MRVTLRFALGYALLAFAYSVYYTISRPLYGVDLYGHSFVLFIAGAEYVPAVFSFLLGSISDAYGRKKILCLSLLGAIPLAVIFLNENQGVILLSISLYSFFYTLAVMISISVVLERRENIGRNYSIIGLASGFGWAFGSSLAWFLHEALAKGIFIFILVSAYITGIYGLFTGYVGDDKKASRKVLVGLRVVYRNLSWFLPVLLLAYIGTAMGSNLNAVILDDKLHSFVEDFLSDVITNSRLLYGLFYAGLPVLIAIPARIIAGKLVDRGKERTLFISSIIAYLLIFPLLPFMSPLIFLLIWLIPVYPFYDTSIYAISARSTGSHESTISGYISTVTSLAGLLVIIINYIVYGMGTLAYVALTALFLLASLAMFLLSGGGKAKTNL